MTYANTGVGGWEDFWWKTRNAISYSKKKRCPSLLRIKHGGKHLEYKNLSLGEVEKVLEMIPKTSYSFDIFWPEENNNLLYINSEEEIR